MARVLTGMSATGKSTVLRQLAARGHRTVGADLEGWSDELPTDDGSGTEQLWRVDRMSALLADEPEGVLHVAGCASNQGRFYDRFDAVVLLSVPRHVLLERLAARDTNPFGKSPAERERILRDLDKVEPLLRTTATTEIDTCRPSTEVVDGIEEVARRCHHRRGRPATRRVPRAWPCRPADDPQPGIPPSRRVPRPGPAPCGAPSTTAAPPLDCDHDATDAWDGLPSWSRNSAATAPPRPMRCSASARPTPQRR